MIKHMVFWKLKDENKKENMQKIKTMLEGLSGKIDGLLNAQVGFNFAGEEFDLALSSDFKDKESLEAYQTHPLHVAVREFITEVRTARAVVDYEY